MHLQIRLHCDSKATHIILWGQMYCVGYKGDIPEAEEVLLEEGLNLKAHRLHYAHKAFQTAM